jgi:predicted nuclease with TOPRIM domain
VAPRHNGRSPNGRHLEAAFARELLAHINKQLEDCRGRLDALAASQTQLLSEAAGEDEERLRRLEALAADTAVVHSRIRRLHAALMLLQAFVDTRRDQLSTLLEREQEATPGGQRDNR